MTTLGPLRSRLLTEYINATIGEPVGDTTTPAPLAQDYIQFLLGHHLPPILAAPHEWAGRSVGRLLANLPGSHEPPSEPRTPWAEYTPSPYVQAGKHRGELWPWRGDLVVFDRSGDTSPHGTLGVYLDHQPGGIWMVYTQGFGPPGIIGLDSTTVRPLGWWRVPDDRLRVRGEVTR